MCMIECLNQSQNLNNQLIADSKVNPIFLKGYIRQELKILDEKLDEIKKSDQFKEFFKILSKFWRYSFQNTLLIYFQYPKASFVAGFRKWNNDFNRYVRKGQKGIRILAPLIKNVENPDNPEERIPKCVGFKAVCVFDISQTEVYDGKPDIINETEFSIIPNEEDSQKYFEKLKKHIDKQKIPLNYKDLGKNGNFSDNGYSNGKDITINSNIGKTHQFFVLIHEYGHHCLHWVKDKKGKIRSNKDYSREKAELEAEAITYIVQKALGFETTTSLNYLAFWKSKENVKNSFENIYRISTEILKKLGK